MTKKESLKLFNDKKVRTVWDDEQEKWYFSVVDVIELTTICSTLKLRATDGKMRLTDVAETEQLFRIIQSVPSPKAEPFKQWMAAVASERLDQIQDPELSIAQAMRDYKRLGYSDNWINQRLKSIAECRTNNTLH